MCSCFMSFLNNLLYELFLYMLFKMLMNLLFLMDT
jgi:hypothetical protein